MGELKANPNRAAQGTVIEARLAKGRGPVATLLAQNGTLHQGDIIIAGTSVAVSYTHLDRQRSGVEGGTVLMEQEKRILLDYTNSKTCSSPISILTTVHIIKSREHGFTFGS